MANVKIRNIATTATALTSEDYLVVASGDGATKKLAGDDLITSVVDTIPASFSLGSIGAFAFEGGTFSITSGLTPDWGANDTPNASNFPANAPNTFTASGFTFTKHTTTIAYMASTGQQTSGPASPGTASAGAHTHDVSGTTASGGAHTHTFSDTSTSAGEPAHTHNVGGSTASGGAHTHTFSDTSSSDGAHSHTVDAHDHTIPAHSHMITLKMVYYLRTA